MFLAVAKPSSWADKNSLVLDDAAPFQVRSDDSGVVISLDLPAKLSHHQHPVISHDFIGVRPHVNQGLTTPDGVVDVSLDLLGRPRDESRTIAGPFAVIRKGRHEVRLWPTAQPANAPR